MRRWLGLKTTKEAAKDMTKEPRETKKNGGINQNVKGFGHDT